MEYLVKIKTIKELNRIEYYASNNLVEMFFIECEDKDEVKKMVAEKYPTLFHDGKVYQKTTKQEKQLCYVQIEKATSWTSEKLKAIYVCKECEETFTGMEYFNLKSRFPLNFEVSEGSCYCSNSCKKKYEIKKAGEEMEGRYERYSNYHYIYKVTEKQTGLCYIGKTSNVVFFRWFEHFKHSTSPFGIYLRGKRLSDFTFEVIEELEKEKYSDSEILLIESEYILKYDAIENGFNQVISKNDIVNEQKL